MTLSSFKPVELAGGEQDVGVTPKVLDRYRAVRKADENKDDEKQDDSACFCLMRPSAFR